MYTLSKLILRVTTLYTQTRSCLRSCVSSAPPTVCCWPVRHYRTTYTNCGHFSTSSCQTSLTRRQWVRRHHVLVWYSIVTMCSCVAAAGMVYMLTAFARCVAAACCDWSSHRQNLHSDFRILLFNFRPHACILSVLVLRRLDHKMFA